MQEFDQHLENKLRQALAPSQLELRNVSHHHAGHAGSPGTGTSHYEADIVSAHFSGLSKVARHRKVYALLAEEMAGPIHALALNLQAPEEVSPN
jgi:BolA protein